MLKGLLLAALVLYPLQGCSNRVGEENNKNHSLFSIKGELTDDKINEAFGTSGKGNLTTAIDIDRNFKGVDVGLLTYVTFEQSNVLSVKAEVPKQLSRKVDIYYEDGLIKVRTKDSYTDNTEKKYIIIRIKAPRFSHASASGASYIEIKGKLQQKEGLVMDLSGASYMKCGEIASEGELEIDLSGASTITADNISFSNIEIDHSGASTIKLPKVETNNVSIDLSGASHLSIAGNMKTVDADVSGCSNLDIKGKAGKASFDVSGVSKVNCAEFECADLRSETSGNSTIVR